MINKIEYLMVEIFFFDINDQCVPTPIKVSPGSNPGRRRELVQNHVAMSRCTNWPPKLSTFMVIDHCTLNIQQCMIHFCVRTTILVNMMYHTFLYLEHTWNYGYICTQFWRSVSASGHGNTILNKLTRPVRVRIRRPQCLCMSNCH